jgi:hypothetical protein
VRDGIFEQVVFVDDTRVEQAPALALVGPKSEGASPVSAKLCAQPKVEDIAVGDDVLYAYVTECHEAAPNRIVTYPDRRDVASWPKDGAMRFAKLAASRTGKLHLAGIRDGHLAIDHLIDGKVSTETFPVVAQVVLATVADDDEAVWVLVLDAGSKHLVTRNGAVVAVGSEPKGLALDDKLGVVVLTANSLFAERPGSRVVLAPRR